MEHKKFYTLASVTALIIFGLWVYINYNSEYTMNRVLDAYTKGEYQKAQGLLDSYRGSIPEEKYFLYTAYNQRGLKNIQASDESLNSALKSSENHRNKDTKFEIYLNQTLNAYLERDMQRFNASLKSASEISPGDEWVVFFKWDPKLF